MPKRFLLTRRRALWLGLATFAGVGAMASRNARYLTQQIQALDDLQRDFTVVGEAPLKERAAAKGLIYGAAGEYFSLAKNQEFATHFTQECAILVPAVEELKWRGLRPSPDRFDFTKGDLLAQFAQERGLLFRGHTLVWHNALPEWFESTVNSQNARQYLLEHISTVVGHYAGKVHSWDVVNEAVNPRDGRADGLRATPWLKFLGSDYIELAFRAAAAADPQALLVYNDHNLDYDAPDNEARRASVLRLLERLKSRGTPVHALGIQAHLLGWQDQESQFDPNKFRAFLRDVAALGLKILITELDVSDEKLPPDNGIRDRLVAGAYEDYLSVVLEEPAVIGVLTWGLSDRHTWLSGARPRRDGLPVRPLPLDAQLKRKLAWNALAHTFDKAPQRS